MKRMKLLLTLILLFCVFFSFGVYANADYGYMVRIFSGNQGTIGGGTVVTNPASFSTSDVTVTSDLYYVKGIRESGKDINPFLTDLPGSYDHDTDFVVVYGLKTDLVTLTIRYVDANGTTLAGDRILNANVGDKPMVRAAYVEGYAPYYRYYTGTLSGDTVWTFEYYPYAGDTTIIYEGGGNAGNVIPVPGNNAGAGGNGGNAGANGTPTTENILDMDVPFASPEDIPGADGTGTAESPPPDNPQAQKRSTLLAKILLWLFIMILLAGIAFLYWFLLFYRKKKKRDSEAKLEQPNRKD